MRMYSKLSRFWRIGNGRYRRDYKGVPITLWKGRDEHGRAVWCGSIELKAPTFHVTRETMLDVMQNVIDKAGLGKPERIT